MSSDEIKRSIVLGAPRSEVWKAFSDSKSFGDWFGVKLDGQFAPGARLNGKVTHKGYENYPFQITVERVLPERVLSWRWHPGADDPKKDYSADPTTLVAFELDDAPGGNTQLTVVESGFDSIPSSRRLEAYQENEKGWDMQMEAIKRHLAKAA